MRKNKFVLTILGANSVKYYVAGYDKKEFGKGLSFGDNSMAVVLEDTFETDQLLAAIKLIVPSAEKERIV